MSTWLYFKYNDGEYKFPVGTNILTGKHIRKVIKTYIPTFVIYKSTRLWIGGYHINDSTVLIFDDSKVVILTDEWTNTEDDNGLLVPTISTIVLDNTVIVID